MHLGGEDRYYKLNDALVERLTPNEVPYDRNLVPNLAEYLDLIINDYRSRKPLRGPYKINDDDTELANSAVALNAAVCTQIEGWGPRGAHAEETALREADTRLDSQVFHSLVTRKLMPPGIKIEGVVKIFWPYGKHD